MTALLHRQEVFQHGVTMLGHDGFGVELQAINGIFLVLEPHDDAIIRPRRRLELVGEPVFAYDERVVAGGHEVLWQPGKQAMRVSMAR